ncbi:hypothetical protein GCM10010306_028750 [Streptomyces umbrinus]|nr:hypothetical protein GCM10010306_028750 [Streptomyces umbrinus]
MEEWMRAARAIGRPWVGSADHVTGPADRVTGWSPGVDVRRRTDPAPRIRANQGEL